MSLAFNLAHPERTDALMLFDTGPGYNKPKGREGWNQFAIRRAEAFETKGLASLGDSAEVKAVRHRSAEGLAKAARGMLTQRDASVIQSLTSIDKPTLVVTGANDQNFLAAHGYMSEKHPGGDELPHRRCRARGEHRQPGRLQRGGRGVPGLATGLEAGLLRLVVRLHVDEDGVAVFVELARGPDGVAEVVRLGDGDARCAEPLGDGGVVAGHV